MKRQTLIASTSVLALTSREWFARATMDARAFALWQKHGDAYAGMTMSDQPILWRPSPIPKTSRCVQPQEAGA